jgi:hypothetical protein
MPLCLRWTSYAGASDPDYLAAADQAARQPHHLGATAGGLPGGNADSSGNVLDANVVLRYLLNDVPGVRHSIGARLDGNTRVD